MYTSVSSSGKVSGAENTPFVLPQRWTFTTLKNCVSDYVNRGKEETQLIVKQLYYKRSQGKGVVKINSDADIPSLLKEYPLTYPSGKRRRSCTMYLAVDLEEKPNQQGKSQVGLVYSFFHIFFQHYIRALVCI